MRMNNPGEERRGYALIQPSTIQPPTPLLAPDLRTVEHYMLTGLTVCGCGHVYHGSNGRYICSSSTSIKRHYVSERCKEPSVKAWKLEGIVWDEVLYLITNPDHLESRLREARDQAYDASKPKRDELNIVNEIIRETETEAADIAQAMIDARGSKLVATRLQAQAQEVDDRHAKLLVRRDALTSEIERATISDEDIAVLAQYRADALAGLENPTPQLKRHWLELLKVRVKIIDGRAELICLISQDGVPRILELKEVRG